MVTRLLTSAMISSTVGRPHPMIDPALRNQLIADLGAKPQVRVLLLDVVIGFGATADPAASLVSAWQKACAARSDNQPLYAIATVTGTERDPQCRSQQIATLEDAGIAVVSSLPESHLAGGGTDSSAFACHSATHTVITGKRRRD